MEFLKELKWDKNGLIPAVIQDGEEGDVLTLCYLNEEALRRTLDTGKVHMYRRSRGRVMQKGEESGHYQSVNDIRVDCEGQSLLIRVRPQGGACHQGYRTCFFREVGKDGKLSIGEERVFDPSRAYGKKEQESE